MKVIKSIYWSRALIVSLFLLIIMSGVLHFRKRDAAEKLSPRIDSVVESISRPR